MLLVDKYAPKTVKQMVGVEYYAMGLTSFLKTWNTPRRQYKAILLSGPPGVGKTILAKLVCTELGLSSILNVDTSRKNISKCLREIGDAVLSRKVSAYITGKMQQAKPEVVIIDELDAIVTGNLERGTLPCLVKFIKESRIPVICICNDSVHQSIKPLMPYCMHIHMQRPPLEDIIKYLFSIAQNEGVRCTREQIKEIAEGSGCDVRHAIFDLQFCSLGNMSIKSDRNIESGLVVDRYIKPFEVVALMFTEKQQQLYRLGSVLYDADAFLGPLLIYENYHKSREGDLSEIALVADAISEGDLFDSVNRRSHSMTDVRAFMTCTKPCSVFKDRYQKQINFPTLFGTFNNINKNKKFFLELFTCTLHHFVEITNLITEVIPLLCAIAIKPIIACKHKPDISNFISKARSIFDSMNIDQKTWNIVLELGMINSNQISTATKTMLTKEMSKRPRQQNNTPKERRKLKRQKK